MAKKVREWMDGEVSSIRIGEPVECYFSTVRYFYVDSNTKVKVSTRYFRNDTETSEFVVIRKGEEVGHFIH